jgi:hypothetical protein
MRQAMKKPIHIMPAHETHSYENCWCKPRLAIGDSEMIYKTPVVWHSFPSERIVPEEEITRILRQLQ